MRLEPRFFDGTARPHWAGPVVVQGRTRPPHPARPSRVVEVSGLVLPLQVPAHLYRGGAHAHTGGTGLGFPDLSGDLLKHPQVAKQWSKVERTIGNAAAHLMGWGSHARPRHAGTADLPPSALRLHLSGMLPGPGEEDAFNPDEHPLMGTLERVIPIHDTSGRKVRMRKAGPVARFHVSASSAGFSRDPRML